ncbi:hypothetical protein D2V17_01900 [Aurantiacibacter xanthus]|uniref:Uncharacterized protein n=1 Tax=Aurantiacibacter xanthus TaxID=1784712 RepID=A0A3A1PHY4_9SPHN|nr:hypothetical protein D2V17_01900 [Aurantiacibacter xanthus]
MKFNPDLTSSVTPIGYDFGAGRQLEDFTGEVVQEQDETCPYRASIKCGSVVVISQNATTQTEAEHILERHLKILRMLKDGVFD